MIIYGGIDLLMENSV